jgi:hypothetical protein
MGRRKDFMPRKDTEFFSFQRILVDKVVANKAAWGIPDADVNPLIARRSEFEPVRVKAQNKNTRTSTDVLAHRQMRKTYEKEIRAFVRKYKEFIPDTGKVGMGLTVRDTEPSPRGLIESIPVVALLPIGGGGIKVICKRETDQNRPSMHRLADAIECRSILVQGRMAINDPEAAPKSQISKKAKFIIQCGDENAGKHFYGFFRWVNLTNPANSGPWSKAHTMIVP